MAYNFRDRLDTLGPRMKGINTVTGVVSRPGVTGGSGDVELSWAIRDTDVIGLENIGGTRLRRQDFILDSADYKIGDPVAVTIPQIGDRITLDDGTVFAVSAMGARFDQGDTECYEYITSSRLRLRVHTQQTIEA